MQEITVLKKLFKSIMQSIKNITTKIVTLYRGQCGYQQANSLESFFFFKKGP